MICARVMGKPSHFGHVVSDRIPTSDTGIRDSGELQREFDIGLDKIMRAGQAGPVGK